MTVSYLNTAVNPPPLNVQLTIKKSVYKIHNEARVIILSSHEASRDWHTGDLMARGFDLWQFVNAEDEVNYNLEGVCNG